jgi:hypothetical protein
MTARAHSSTVAAGIERDARIDDATEAAVESDESFENILELMAAIERRVGTNLNGRENEIAAALRRSAEADAREIKAVQREIKEAVQEIKNIERDRDYKLDAAQQIEELIEYFARTRRQRLQWGLQ